MFILAQISVFIAWFFLLISYYRKNTNNILIFHILAIVFYLLNYWLLGAWTGFFIVSLELIRDIFYYKTNKDNFIFLATLPFYIISFFFAKDNFLEFVPIIASILEGFTLTKKKNIVVPGAIVVYSLWILYDMRVGSYIGALTNFIIVISNIFILLNIFKSINKINHFKFSSRYTINKGTFNKMFALKKDAYAKELLTSNSYEEKLYKQSKNTFIFIKFKKELMGFITKIKISKKTLNKILKLNIINEEYEDLILKSNFVGNFLLIDSIVLKEKYQNKKAKELIVNKIKKIIKKQESENIFIIASTCFEKEIVKNLNFIKIKNLNNNSIIYSYKDI